MNSRTKVIFFSSLGLILLILDTKTARIGISEGIALCLNTLIPSLFPFCVLSTLLTGNLTNQPMAILKPICKFCRIPQGCESLLLIGWLGGYPVGAQNVAAAHRSGVLSSEDAARMAIICNNPGPAFLFGILGPIISGKHTVLLMWWILLCSSLLTAHLIPGGTSHEGSLPPHEVPSFPSAIRSGIASMANICANVMFMGMILEFLTKWIPSGTSHVVTTLICGILEVSNGCFLLPGIENPAVRCLVANALLSFGGICVWMQTVSVCHNLDLKAYLKWKLVQSLLTFIMTAAIFLPRLLIPLLPILTGKILLRHFGKIGVDFPKIMLYSSSKGKK